MVAAFHRDDSANMTGIPRNVAGWLAKLFKRKAKEVVEEAVEEAIEEAIEVVKEELSDVFGVYTIEGKSHGLPRRVYADGTVRVGGQVIHPKRRR